MQKIKALVWDMDGTLLNTLDDIIGACNETLRAWNLPERPKNEMIMFIGYGARHLCHCASGLENDELMQFLKDYRARTINRDDPKTCVYPGILEILGKSRQCGMKNGIYTNKPQYWCEKLTKKFFGDGLFDAIKGVQEGCVLKPQADGIWEMCEAWHINPSEVVMIGDTPVDWETAQNARSQCVCVTWGFRSRKILESAGASIIVDSADELKQILFGEHYLE